MPKRNLYAVACIFLVGLILLCCTGEKGESDVPGSTDYADLASLFKEFRGFAEPKVTNGVPDYTVTAMDKQYRELKTFQNRLAAIDPGSWSVSEQVDYLVVRAEMNGLEFQHRVLHPWSRDPSFYLNLIPRLPRTKELPLQGDAMSDLRMKLQAISEICTQAQMNLKNLSEVAGDLAIFAIHELEKNSPSVQNIVTQLADQHPDLVSDAKKTQAAIDSYLSWLKENQNKMTASAGIGLENYNWLLKNVYLFPYTWEDCRRIVELEDNRVITFQKLEENRNRYLPPLKPCASQAEYKAGIYDAVDHIMNFLRDEEIFTVYDYLVPDRYYASRMAPKGYGLDKPWPEKHDYFFNFSHREPVMENTHEMVGHHFDRLRSQHDNRPIRGKRRLYKVGTSRSEGFAFALEELLMHAGYLDGRSPHGREIAYQQAAFRTVRALSDLYMHNKEWSLTEAMEFCVKNAPRGDLLDDSPHLWHEMRTILRGPGHHMLMVVGKVQYMGLFRDRAQQLGDKFSLRQFMDEFLAAGMIPMALTRWEMTGFDDEIKDFW
jgi:hypothetical protein